MAKPGGLRVPSGALLLVFQETSISQCSTIAEALTLDALESQVLFDLEASSAITPRRLVIELTANKMQPHHSAAPQYSVGLVSRRLGNVDTIKLWASNYIWRVQEVTIRVHSGSMEVINSQSHDTQFADLTGPRSKDRDLGSVGCTVGFA